MSDLSEYQRLIEDYPRLQEREHREAFDRFVARMWTKPTSFKHYVRAYLEFITPEKPTFRKLDALHRKRQKTRASAEQPRERQGSRSRRRRSRGRQ